MKVIYFTGTGNSLYIAKQFKEVCNAQLLSIPQLMKQETISIQDECVGIIFPIYGLEVPAIVDEFLKKVHIQSEYTFVILNHALFALETKGVLNRYNIQVDYVEQVKMPNNYLPVFNMETTNKNKRNYDKYLNKIVNDIQNRESKNKTNKIKLLIGNGIRKVGKIDYNKEDKKFFVEDRCVGCGVCQKVCPVNNVIMKDNKIEFQHRCEQCLACIHHCPIRAIHHKSEKNESRYRHAKISLEEIIEANQ